EAQLHRVALGILDEVAVLEELARHQVLEARAALGGHRPVPEVELALLLDGPHPGSAERGDAEADVEVLQDRQPALHGLVIDLEVLAKALDRERRADAARQQVDELLDEGDLPDMLQVAEIVADDSREAIALPEPKLALVLQEEGLREATEVEKRVEIA